MYLSYDSGGLVMESRFWDELDVAARLRAGAVDNELRALFRAAAAAKPSGRQEFQASALLQSGVAARPMIRIGG
jgi:hypothetical protein